MQALSDASAWDADRVRAFLESFEAPARVAVTTEKGFPLICSLWYRFVDDRLLCATQRDARVARALERDPRCAFEVSTNEAPYRGVRGRAVARIDGEGGEAELGRLLDRYVGGRDSEFAQWLLSRADSEVVLTLEPEWMTSWDFSDRMPG